MIDWKKSAELNNCTVEWLRSRFVRFPKSNKKVWRVCEGCCREQEMRFADYADLCNSCSKGTSKVRGKMSRSATKRWSTQFECDIQAERLQRYHKDNPEVRIENAAKQVQYAIDHPEYRKHMAIKTTEYYADLDHRKESSERLKNSEACKVEHERQRGGNDIVMHHWLYDDADLSKYTMPMTRSDHTAMHRRMQLDGYSVKHINSDTDDNGLWGYK